VSFYFLCSLRPESPEQHLLTNIAEVPSAARYKASVSNMSAKRFAQDDGFVVG
jgi:hypothetical protein